MLNYFSTSRFNLFFLVKQRSLIKRFLHPFHIVDPSVWPIFVATAFFDLTLGGVNVLHTISGSFFLKFGFTIFLVGIFLWLHDVLTEATFEGRHTLVVRNGLKLGFIMFIISEVLFFVAFFWSFFHMSLAPAVELGSVWPPLGITTLNAIGVPLVNTIILLLSGVWVTSAHGFFSVAKYYEPAFYLLRSVKTDKREIAVDLYHWPTGFFFYWQDLQEKRLCFLKYELYDQYDWYMKEVLSTVKVSPWFYNFSVLPKIVPNVKEAYLWYDEFGWDSDYFESTTTYCVSIPLHYPAFIKPKINGLRKIVNHWLMVYPKTVYYQTTNEFFNIGFSILPVNFRFLNQKYYMRKVKSFICTRNDAKSLIYKWTPSLDDVANRIRTAAGLGLVFLILQYSEYTDTNFDISDSVYGTLFFVTTGFHGFHVLIGMIMLVIASTRAASGHFFSSSALGFEAAAWYWHFVDVVWLFLYIFIYHWGS